MNKRIMEDLFMHKVFKTDYAGRELIVETGEVAQFANGAVLIRYGDTVLLCTATASSVPREGIDFFPLSVDFEEKLYAVGKIPGGYVKREGKPSEKAILAARAIDRPLRPRFPGDLRNDVVINCTVLSVDQDNSPEITGMVGAAIAVNISDIPFDGPVGGIIIGLVDDKFVFNPTSKQSEVSKMNVMLAASKDKIIMIEAGAQEVDDRIMLEAIKAGHEEIKKLIVFIEEITKEVGKPKFEYESMAVPEEAYQEIGEFAHDMMVEALFVEDKAQRDLNVNKVTEIVQEKFGEKYIETPNVITDSLYKLQKKIVRTNLLENKKRVDGRSLDQIRPLNAKVGLLPRTHGSALFQRGQTQIISTVTLGAMAEVQMLDGIGLEETKRYMHHYNFPSFSVGEAKPSRGAGRREIGHGALAERAILPVLPTEEEFPYAIRVVSEVMMSNGSTSQGSVCGSTLALMDAGVPIKEPVAGISAGLVIDEENPDRHVTFADIQGIEDFFGDMDFKVAGTKNGITAIQVDIKVDGLTYDIIEEAFEITRKGRYFILDECMLKVIDKPREQLSKYAPKIFQTKIHPDKIREVIGSGGKVINKIIDETGVKIDIDDDGHVYVYTDNEEMGRRAIQIVEGIANEPEVGSVYMGKVVRIMNFGAFVEFLPGKEGMVHISKLDTNRVNRVEDIVNVGDEILVKVIEIEKQGRINLSRKDALKDQEKDVKKKAK
jgi:polyribonucleotide nucleotidyltransferase